MVAAAMNLCKDWSVMLRDLYLVPLRGITRDDIIDAVRTISASNKVAAAVAPAEAASGAAVKVANVPSAMSTSRHSKIAVHSSAVSMPSSNKRAIVNNGVTSVETT